MVLAGIFLAAAVYVVVRVAGAIHKDYSQIEWSSEHKTETAQSIEIEEGTRRKRAGSINCPMTPTQRISGWKWMDFYIILMKTELWLRGSGKLMGRSIPAMM